MNNRAYAVHVINLLPHVGVQSFGQPAAHETYRKTVVAVIYRPHDQTYLCQYWKDYSGLTCLLSGGVEPGEDVVEALQREIAEETGYKQYKIVGQLGAPVYSHYGKAKTGEHFVKEIVPFLVILNGASQHATSLEEDEKFENMFRPSDDILQMMAEYEALSGSTMADHKAILQRARSVLPLT